MFTSAHVVIYSQDAEADRAVFRDIFGWPHIDAGDGWLIFRLPPAEAAFHPTSGDTPHELYLTCDDIAATRDALDAKGIATTPPTDEGWGILTSLTLPGGSRIGIYQPRHPTAV